MGGVGAPLQAAGLEVGSIQDVTPVPAVSHSLPIDACKLWNFEVIRASPYGNYDILNVCK